MNAARANGLFLPPVEIGYAPLYIIRDTPAHPDSAVILGIKSLIVGVTLTPPTVAALLITALLILGEH